MQPRVHALFAQPTSFLSITNKEILPAIKRSNVIYQFSCQCDSRNLRSISPSLQYRIKQHVCKSIHSGSLSQKLVVANLPPSLIPSLLFLIQPLDFIFYKLLPVLNITLTVNSLFFRKNALFLPLSIVALEATSLKLVTPSSINKTNFYIA